MRAAALAIGVQVMATLVVGPGRGVEGRTPARDTAGVDGVPIVSVWYRGSPVGTPRQPDLAAIRARGFGGITWPSRQTAGTADVARMAADVGLRVTLRIDPVPITPASARMPGQAVDIPVAGARPEEFAALAWRAVAHGAGVVSFDPGGASGTGLDDAAGHPRPWVASATALGAAFDGQAQLFEGWRPAGRVTVSAPAPDALDLQLLEDARSWILVVTSTSRGRVRAVAHLPAGVPAALWINLLDGAMLSMISQPAGARWSLDLEADAVRVYVVSK